MITSLGFVAFVVFGVVLVLVGSNQAELARSLRMDLAASGLLGAALALGAGIGVTSAGPLVDRLPRRPLFLASVLLASLALLTVDGGIGYARAVGHVLVLGVGAGFYDTLLNAVAIERYGANAGRPLALLHAGATLGAMLGPPIVGLLAAVGGWTTSFHATGLAFVALAVWVAFVPLPRPVPRDPATRVSAGSGPLFGRALLALGVVAFAYVGVETAVTLLCVPWATDGLGLGAERGRAAISTFWFGLLTGRLGLLALRRPAGPGFLAATGVAGALVLAAAAATRAPALEATTALAGLALGAVYPVMIGLAGARFPGATATAAGLVAGAGALGGFVVPWAVGALGDARGVLAAVAALAAASLAITAGALALGPSRPARS